MWAAVSTTTAAQLPVFLTGALSVQIGRGFPLGTRGLAIAVAAFFGSSALCSAGLGRLSDRVGGATMMRLGTVPAVAALLWIGLGVHDRYALAAALALAGAANGAIQPAANRHLSRTVRESRQGFAFGVKQAAIPAATLLSGLAVPVAAHAGDWRWLFVAAAVTAAIVGALVRRPAAAATRRQNAARDSPADRGSTAHQATFARSALLTLGVGVGAASAAANALGAFFVMFAVSIGTSDATAGLVAAAASLVSILVRLGSGVRADRRAGGHLRRVSLMCAVGSIGPLLLAVGDRRLLAVAALIGYGIGWGWAGVFNFAVARTHPVAPGRATGLTQVGASSGACLGPLCFGLAAAHFGFRPAWIGAAIALLAAAAVILLGRRALYAAGVV